MRTLRGIAAVLLVFVVFGGLVACGQKDEVIAKVNGEEITRSEFDRLFQQVVNSTGGSLDETTTLTYKRMLLDMLVEMRLVTQEAERLGADLSDEAVQEQIDGLMGGSTDSADFEARLAETGMTMEDLRASIRYNIGRTFLAEHVKNEASATVLPQALSQLEHILVEDEALADGLYQQIQDGADFNELASANSVDGGSAVNGGSLGWASTSDYVAEFKAAADALAIGEVSEPVKSEFGWHIIRKVDEVAKGTPVSELEGEPLELYDATSGDIQLNELIARLREAAKVEYLDETLAPEKTE